MPERVVIVGLVLLAVAALVAGCGGSDEAPNVQTKTAHLYQFSPGANPVMRMGWRDNVPDPSAIVAWFVYRGEYFAFPAEPQNLTNALRAESLAQYEDPVNGVAQINFNTSFTYFLFGEQETGDIDVTYDRASLMVGRTYYYRARRIVKPNQSAPPISTAAASTFTIDPSNALSQPSSPQGPVTYFLPPAGTQPSNGSLTVNPRQVIFRWTTSAGADTYQVRVYTTPTATGQPVLQSPDITALGSVGTWIHDRTGTTPVLRGQAYYYWVVGAKRTGEAAPTCGTESGWLKGSVMQFHTTSTPPGIP